jgi:hypothetical protein
METTLYAAIKQVRDALHAGAPARLAIHWAARRFQVDPVDIAVHVIEAQRATNAARALRLAEQQEGEGTKPTRSLKKDLQEAA